MRRQRAGTGGVVEFHGWFGVVSVVGIVGVAGIAGVCTSLCSENLQRRVILAVSRQLRCVMAAPVPNYCLNSLKARVIRAQAATKIVALCAWRQRGVVLQGLGGPADDCCHR